MMPVIKYIERIQDIFLYKNLQRQLSDCKTVLDVGCGANSPLGKIKKTFYAEGIDIFQRSLQQSKKRRIHEKYIKGDIKNLNKYYKRKSFDAVIVIDVIEHIEKKDSLKLIQNIEEIARKKVVILTPNGYQEQDELWGNPYQKHRSAWYIEDLRKLNYSVYGLRGLKYLREHAAIKHKPWILWGAISFLSEPLLYFVPKLSYDLFAVKKLS